MTTALKRTGAALLTLLMFCMLTLGASAAANTPVGVKFWKENSDKESMANSGIDSDREAILTRQSNGTSVSYTHLVSCCYCMQWSFQACRSSILPYHFSYCVRFLLTLVPVP